MSYSCNKILHNKKKKNYQYTKQHEGTSKILCETEKTSHRKGYSIYPFMQNSQVGKTKLT